MTAPDTITSWIISAFSMSDQHGLGIADTFEVSPIKYRKKSKKTASQIKKKIRLQLKFYVIFNILRNKEVKTCSDKRDFHVCFNN